jgi:hypothetical protein
MLKINSNHSEFNKQIVLAFGSAYRVFDTSFPAAPHFFASPPSPCLLFVRPLNGIIRHLRLRKSSTTAIELKSLHLRASKLFSCKVFFGNFTASHLSKRAAGDYSRMATECMLQALTICEEQ